MGRSMSENERMLKINFPMMFVGMIVILTFCV
jgi:hypothetical protein